MITRLVTQRNKSVNKILNDTVLHYGTVVGSFARWMCMEGACKPDDIDVAPFTLEAAKLLIGELVDNYGYNVVLETDNAWNLIHEWGHTPEIDILKKRVGMPEDVIATFPLNNEAFALVSPVLVLSTAEAVQAELSGIITVQNWYRDTPKRIGKLAGKPRSEGYVIDPLALEHVHNFYDPVTELLLLSGGYTSWKDKTYDEPTCDTSVHSLPSLNFQF